MSVAEPLRIIQADRIDGDELVVGYSDGTAGVYSVSQISALTPLRKIENSEACEVAELPR
jgi:hypothetical protein